MNASKLLRAPADSQQLLADLRDHEAQAALLRAAYSACVPTPGMSWWIAVAASELRESHGRLMVHVAAELSSAESKISRFERHKSFPDDIDQTIDAYARDLDVPAVEIWARALDLWREAMRGADGRAQAPAGELARRLEDAQTTSESPPSRRRRRARGALPDSG